MDLECISLQNKALLPVRSFFQKSWQLLFPGLEAQFLAQVASELPEWPVPQQQLYPAGPLNQELPDHVLLKSGLYFSMCRLPGWWMIKLDKVQNISAQAWHYLQKDRHRSCMLRQCRHTMLQDLN